MSSVCTQQSQYERRQASAQLSCAVGSGMGGSLNACQSEDGYMEIEELEFKEQGRRCWNGVPDSVMLLCAIGVL